MMKSPLRRLILSLVLVCLMSLGGCATALQGRLGFVHQEGSAIYGGIRTWINSLGDLPDHDYPVLTVCASFLDMPLCLIADTMLLWYSIPNEILQGGINVIR